MAKEIMLRASDVETRSKVAYDNAISLSREYDVSLKKSIDNEIKIVDKEIKYIIYAF